MVARRWSGAVLAAVGLAGLAVGGTIGFFVGVFSSEFGQRMLEGAVAVEQQAKVSDPTAVERPRFAFEYPSNWILRDDEEDFDADQYFTIDTPGSSLVTFTILEVASEPSEDVEENVGYYEQLMSSESRSPFSNWGGFGGYGVHLRGRYVGNAAEVRVFGHSSQEMSFVVTEFYYTEDRVRVRPGYELISKTFRLRDAKEISP